MTVLVVGRSPEPGAPRWVEIRGASIAAVGYDRPPRPADVEHDGAIAPGLCDLQVNGAGGADALDGGTALDEIDAQLTRSGVTRWLAALPTAEDDRVAAAVAAIAARARDPAHGLVGAHLEGPFLSPEHAGVHRTELLRAPDDGTPRYYDDACVRLVTLAPELPGALALIAALRARGVAVALGHSGADATTALRALDAGATLVTHVFNAMAPLLHRSPGLIGVALTDERARPCVIADGHHLDPIVLRLVAAAAGSRVVLVSDAAAPAAAPDREYRLGGRLVRRDADGAVRTTDGTLAGSGMLLDEIVHTWARCTGTDQAAATVAASSLPAAAIGRTAGLVPGAPADLVLRASDSAPQRVMRDGRWVQGAC